ncbi:lipid asymmetry maintenance protein MlaB [Shewanella sp. SR44-3]|uniref:STAS domain-containing protein n=1 Tax=unclassified Shewanella TaxID=196818 RepID=UPI0015F8010B|nr:STAS domain-containing protein [Shewanella sp. SR44-3]MBB1268333.1 STAS domain-containing protein [Shewanella sp. SR44-3]
MLTFSQIDNLSQAKIEGAMTIHNAFELKNQLMEVLNVAHSIELDLSAVTEIDAAGLQLLIMAKKQQAMTQLELTLIHHSEAVVEAMELMGLVSWFNDPVIMTRQ